MLKSKRCCFTGHRPEKLNVSGIQNRNYIAIFWRRQTILNIFVNTIRGPVFKFVMFIWWIIAKESLQDITM